MAEESRTQEKILKDLRNMRPYCKCTKIMRASDNGFPDIFFTTALTGAVLIEAKAKGKDAQKLQKVFISQLRECGCKSYVCDSWENWVILKGQLGIHLRENLQKAHDKRNRLLSKQ